MVDSKKKEDLFIKGDTRSVDDIIGNILEGTPNSFKPSHSYTPKTSVAPSIEKESVEEGEKQTETASSYTKQKEEAYKEPLKKISAHSENVQFKSQTVMGTVSGDTGESELDREALEEMDRLISEQKAGLSLHKFMVTDAFFKIKGVEGIIAAESAILNAKDSIFVLMVDPTHPEMMERFWNLTQKAPYVFGVVGYTSKHIRSAKIPDVENIRSLILSSGKIIGMGEIGLNYFYNNLTKDLQKELFEDQLRLAYELDVPVFITSRNADHDTYLLLNKLRAEGITPDIVYTQVIRTLEAFQMVLDHGMHLALRPEITYEEENLYRECIFEIPRERLLISSGNEAKAPQKYAGNWNSPTYIKETIDYCVEMFREEKKQFMRQISENFNDLFNSDPEAGDDEFFFQPSSLESTLLIKEAKLLENDVDSDGDELYIKEIEDEMTVGDVYFDRDNRLVVYTPRPGFIGADKFNYVVTDGRGGTDKAIVTIFVAEKAEAQEAIEDRPLTHTVDADVKF